jgi:hypothetical protein
MAGNAYVCDPYMKRFLGNPFLRPNFQGLVEAKFAERTANNEIQLTPAGMERLQRWATLCHDQAKDPQRCRMTGYFREPGNVKLPQYQISPWGNLYGILAFSVVGRVLSTQRDTCGPHGLNPGHCARNPKSWV